MTPEEMRTLYDYNAWANHRSLDAAATFDERTVHKTDGIEFFVGAGYAGAHLRGGMDLAGAVSGALASVACQIFWNARMWTSLRAKWAEQEARLLTFVGKLTQEDLNRVMEYKTLKFGVYKNPLWQSMQHVVNHGTYHRGQVTTLLRQLGAQPILTDLMHYYRERATAASA